MRFNSQHSWEILYKAKFLLLHIRRLLYRSSKK